MWYLSSVVSVSRVPSYGRRKGVNFEFLSVMMVLCVSCVLRVCVVLNNILPGMKCRVMAAQSTALLVCIARLHVR